MTKIAIALMTTVSLFGAIHAVVTPYYAGLSLIGPAMADDFYSRRAARETEDAADAIRHGDMRSAADALEESAHDQRMQSYEDDGIGIDNN